MSDKPSYRIHQENDDWIITEISPNYGRALPEYRITGPMKDKIRLTFEHATRNSPIVVPAPDLAAACLALAPDHLTLTEIVDYLVAQIPEPKFGPKEIQARIDALEKKLAAVRSEYTEVLRQNNACSVAITNLSNQINIIMNDVSTLKAGLK